MKQLKLWVDDDGSISVQCTHCGTRFDARAQLEQRRLQVLDDPRVAALPGPSKSFLIKALPILIASPEPVGPSVLAAELPYTTAGVLYQLRRLSDFGIVRPQLMRSGGRNHRYELAIS